MNDAAIMASSLAVVIVDARSPDSRVAHFSRGAEKMFGYKRAEVVNKSVALVDPRQDMFAFLHVSGAVNEARESYLLQTTLKRKSGATFAALCAIYPLLDDRGHVRAGVGMVIDLTATAHARVFPDATAEKNAGDELALRVLHEVTNDLSRMESLEDLCKGTVELGRSRLGFDRLSVWLLDKANNEVIGTFGVDEEGHLRDEREFRIDIEPESDMAQILKRNAPVTIKREAPIFNHKVEPVGFGTRAMAGLWDGEEVIGFLATDNLLQQEELTEDRYELLSLFAASLGHLCSRMRAVEALRKKEEQLRHAQKMEAIGRLAGGIAHDFNNLLTAILGFGGKVKEALGKENALYDDMHEVICSAERAARLTTQLLTLARKPTENAMPVEINAAVEEMAGLLSRTLGEDVKLVSDLDEGAGCVEIEPAHLDQIMMNLAVNARDAMHHGGTLTIRTKRVSLGSRINGYKPGEYVLLSIRDTGQGIPKHIQERIFEPFFTTKEPGKGTGLGLSTVYGIVNQCGGYIDVASLPGQGTEIRIHLPCVDRAEIGEFDEDLVETVPRGDETVLVVEDEEAVRKWAVVTLESLGYNVLEASHGGEALRVFDQYDQGRVDLVLTDVIMPQLGALELVERLGLLDPDFRVLLMSGYVDEEQLASDFQNRGIPLLRKPFTRAELARSIRSVLDGGGHAAL